MVMLRVNSDRQITTLPKQVKCGGLVKCLRFMLLPIGIDIPLYWGCLFVLLLLSIIPIDPICQTMRICLACYSVAKQRHQWMWDRLKNKPHVLRKDGHKMLRAVLPLYGCTNGIGNIAPYLRIHHCHVVRFHTRSTQLCWFVRAVAWCRFGYVVVFEYQRIAIQMHRRLVVLGGVQWVPLGIATVWNTVTIVCPGVIMYGGLVGTTPHHMCPKLVCWLWRPGTNRLPVQVAPTVIQYGICGGTVCGYTMYGRLLANR